MNLRKIVGIIAVIAILGFVFLSCEEEEKTSFGTTLKLSDQVWTQKTLTNAESMALYAQYLSFIEAKNWSAAVKFYNDNTKEDLVKYEGAKAFDVDGNTGTITGGKLNFEMGAPAEALLKDITVYAASMMINNYTSFLPDKTDVKIYILDDFNFGSGDYSDLSQSKSEGSLKLSGSTITEKRTSSYVDYVYVTDNVKFTVVGKENKGTNSTYKTNDYTLSLKKGWNSVTITTVMEGTGPVEDYYGEEEEQKYTYTTSVKAGSTGKWIFSSYSNED